MRRVLAASLLLPSLFLPAVAKASTPVDDATAPTPVRISTGIIAPVLLGSPVISLPTGFSFDLIPPAPRSSFPSPSTRRASPRTSRSSSRSARSLTHVSSRPSASSTSVPAPSTTNQWPSISTSPSTSLANPLPSPEPGVLCSLSARHPHPRGNASRAAIPFLLALFCFLSAPSPPASTVCYAHFAGPVAAFAGPAVAFTGARRHVFQLGQRRSVLDVVLDAAVVHGAKARQRRGALLMLQRIFAAIEIHFADSAHVGLPDRDRRPPPSARRLSSAPGRTSAPVRASSTRFAFCATSLSSSMSSFFSRALIMCSHNAA